MGRDIDVDLFAGGGGASTALKAALGRPVDLAINHSAVALAVHEANHPETKHLPSDIWEVEPLIATRGRPVFALWASPSCTHFSRAASSVPLCEQQRSHADVVTKWARQTRPEFIFLENVAEFLTWGPLDERGRAIPEKKGADFLRWKGELEALGYSVDWRVLDASDYGAPTRRKRLFLVARRDGQPVSWPSPTHGEGLLPYRSAAECIDWSLPIPSIFGRKRPLKPKTLERIAEGVRRFVVNAAPFVAPVQVSSTPEDGSLVAAFLTKHFGGVYGQPLTLPMSTITATDHHAVTAVALAKFRGTSPNQPMSCDVRAPLPTISAGGIHVAAVGVLLAKHGVPVPVVRVNGEEFGIADIGMRMLEPHELLAAQFGRFAADYDLSAAKTKSAKIRLIGNSVPPEVAEAVIRANVAKAREVAA